jgi:hypothetical protein
MQEKSKSWSPAETGIATAPIEGIDYWNGLLSTTPATIQDYTTQIICGDSDAAVSLNKAYTNATTIIDSLQNWVEDATAAVSSSNTATLKAYT